MSVATCEHFETLVTVVPPLSDVCPLCIETDDTWVHLRACLDCGMVGCCDDSKNTHARKHWETQGHSLIQSIEPDENWRYCFADDVTVVT